MTITGTLANGFALCEFLSFFPVNVYWLAFLLTLLIGNTAILTPLFCIQIYWVNPLTPSLTLFATIIAIFLNLVKVVENSTFTSTVRYKITQQIFAYREGYRLHRKEESH